MTQSSPVRLALASLAVVAALAGCSDDETPPAVAARWQLICPNMAPNCAPALSNVVNSFDGEMGNDVACRASSSTDDLLTLSFSAGNPSGRFSLEVRRALVSRSSRAITSRGCEVVIEEDGNVYEGACGSSPPNEETPCQITFPEDAGEGLNLEGGRVNALVLCVDIPQRVSNLSRATVFDVDRTFDPNDPVASDLGAPFLFRFCGGV